MIRTFVKLFPWHNHNWVSWDKRNTNGDPLASRNTLITPYNGWASTLAYKHSPKRQNFFKSNTFKTRIILLEKLFCSQLITTEIPCPELSGSGEKRTKQKHGLYWSVIVRSRGFFRRTKGSSCILLAKIEHKSQKKKKKMNFLAQKLSAIQSNCPLYNII